MKSELELKLETLSPVFIDSGAEKVMIYDFILDEENGQQYLYEWKLDEYLMALTKNMDVDEIFKKLQGILTKKKFTKEKIEQCFNGTSFSELSSKIGGFKINTESNETEKNKISLDKYINKKNKILVLDEPTTPCLDTTIMLNGYPYIPGSSVKGVVNFGTRDSAKRVLFRDSPPIQDGAVCLQIHELKLKIDNKRGSKKLVYDEGRMLNPCVCIRKGVKTTVLVKKTAYTNVENLEELLESACNSSKEFCNDRREFWEKSLENPEVELDEKAKRIAEKLISFYKNIEKKDNILLIGKYVGNRKTATEDHPPRTQKVVEIGGKILSFGAVEVEW